MEKKKTLSLEEMKLKIRTGVKAGPDCLYGIQPDEIGNGSVQN